MVQLFQQMKWQLILLQRNNLITISVVVTCFYALIFYILKDFANLEYLLTVLIYNDPALIGLAFIGVSLLLEKDEGVSSVWLITPMNKHAYSVARILVLSLIGWVCAFGMALVLLGTSFQWVHFSIGVFSTCLLFSLVGVLLMSTTTDILMFMLKAIPVLILMSFPFLNYFQLTDIFLFKFWPIQGALMLIVHSYQKSSVMPSSELYFAYASNLFWLALMYWAAYRCLYSKILKNG